MLATMLGPEALARAVAERARALRLHQNLTQAGLAVAAGVSLGALKRFERTGEIAFVSLVRLAIALGATGELETWFQAPRPQTLDELLARPKLRQRGRR